MKRICESDQFISHLTVDEVVAPLGDVKGCEPAVNATVAKVQITDLTLSSKAKPANSTGYDNAATSSVVVGDKWADKFIDNSELKLGWWAVFVKSFRNWREQCQTRKILRGLSDTQLKDIGLSCRDIDKLYGERDYSRRVWPNWPK